MDSQVPYAAYSLGPIRYRAQEFTQQGPRIATVSLHSSYIIASRSGSLVVDCSCVSLSYFLVAYCSLPRSVGAHRSSLNSRFRLHGYNLNNLAIRIHEPPPCCESVRTNLRVYASSYTSRILSGDQFSSCTNHLHLLLHFLGQSCADCPPICLCPMCKTHSSCRTILHIPHIAGFRRCLRCLQ
jgi:hypothetical protein